LKCGWSITKKYKSNKLQKVLWQKFVWRRCTLVQLATEYRHSIKWVQQQLDKAAINIDCAKPQSIVAVSDATFWGRGYGVLVVRCPRLKRNIHYHEIATETPLEYLQARRAVEARGFALEAAVIDGKRGIKAVFADVPVQMCQFHQIQIVKRYLTSRPKLDAGKELRAITLALPASTEKSFTELLEEWHNRWKDFLKERTYREDGKHWQYTHRRIRSAYRSLKSNLLNLFTYQRYPEIKIPNTTNSLDGYFNRLKSLLNIHRGLNKQRRYKLIQEILNH
jgi:hypothetical protein